MIWICIDLECAGDFGFALIEECAGDFGFALIEECADDLNLH